MATETEAPYYDENGVEIKEFAVIRVFHFVGTRRKKHYMYKWVWLVETNGVKKWVGKHLSDGNLDFFYFLRFGADPETRRIPGTVVVQTPAQP